MNKVLFFETYSVIQTVLLRKHIAGATLIYFHRRGFPRPDFGARAKERVTRLVRLFNPKAEIRTIPTEKVYQYNWDLNKESLRFVEERAPLMERSPAYRLAVSVLGNANTLKYFKARLAEDIPDAWLFLKVARDLISQHGPVGLVPADNDRSFLERELFGSATLRPYYLPHVHSINRFRSILHRVGWLGILLLLPASFTILRLGKLTLRRVPSKTYDVAMAVTYGFHDGAPGIEGVKRVEDDGYLYDDKLTPGRIIHVFGKWQFSADVKAGYKRMMDRRGIPYADTAEYRMGPGFLLAAGKVQLQVLAGLLRSAFFRGDSPVLVRWTAEAIYTALLKLLELENVEYRVEFSLRDYSAAHIIETILSRQRGRRTVGLQHNSTAGPYVANALCFAHLDKYCIFSDGHLRLYSPYWNGLHLEKIGSPWIDNAVALLDEKAVSSARDRIISLYGRRQYIALITFPGGAEHTLPARLDEMYRALCDLRSHNVDCHVFLRFRSQQHISTRQNSRFAKLAEEDKRIVLDHTNFTTYDLMAACDLCITAAHSSALIEAVALRKKAFTFDYLGTAPYCFGGYGKDMILTTKEDVLRRFSDLETGFAGYDCNWEQLRADYNYHYDGKSTQRLRQVLLDTVDEIKASQRGDGRKHE